MNRRQMLQTLGTVAAGSVVSTRLIEATFGPNGVLAVQALPLNSVAGVDRVVMSKGKTYLNGWVGYGQPTRGRGGAGRAGATPPPEPPGPPPTAAWSKVSGPGTVTFADPKAPITTATFSAEGEYVLKVVASNGTGTAESTLTVKVEAPPAGAQFHPVFTTSYAITSPMWSSRMKAILTHWIPHCIDQCERMDATFGGIDNFIEAGKALRDEPHGKHKGYVFSNAWVHQTLESMCLGLMFEAQGDKDILEAQNRFRTTLDRWIPIILAAQHKDGYLQTAFTLRDMLGPTETYPAGGRGVWTDRWIASHRNNHEGYVAGYFIESAINHYMLTGGKDKRLYNAAKKLADCWADHIGPSSAKASDGKPKQEWFDGHQEMEQALVRFGRFVNEVEPIVGGSNADRTRVLPGDRYIQLAKFLLDCRKGGSEYDQSHLPVVQQYEAVGHAVRAMYTYSGMADVAVETHDVDYQSAVKSLWDNIVHRKYYLTGGVGSGETSEGFGPNYSLRQNAYCETCSSCGEVFFQWKMHLSWHDAKYAALYEQTIYNALGGSLDFEGNNFYYTNPLDARSARAPWNSVACCVGNLSRTLLMMPTWMYSKGPNAIHVNLFAGSRVMVENVAGLDVELVQTTDYPWNGKVSIVVNTRSARNFRSSDNVGYGSGPNSGPFALRIRVPQDDVSSLYTATPPLPPLGAMTVNGQRVTSKIVDGYAEIKRTWKKGDKVEFELPLPAQFVRADARIEEARGKVAIRRGPLVYNIEQVDQDITQTVDTKAALTPEWRPDLLGGVTVLKGAFTNGASFMAIPNYVRVNRNPPPPPRPSPTPTPTPVAGAAPTPAPRPAPLPPNSIVWLKGN
jgi:DUF1680 family protein